jgi:hypothetical protein
MMRGPRTGTPNVDGPVDVAGTQRSVRISEIPVSDAGKSIDLNDAQTDDNGNGVLSRS